MRDVHVLSSPAEVKALGHPLRIAILTALGQPRTNLQVARAIGESASKTFFHMRELAEVGLIEIVEQRPKGGVIEKYYQATARHFELNSEMLGAGVDQDVIGAALVHAYRRYQRNVSRGPGPVVNSTIIQESVSLEPARRQRIEQLLDQLRTEIEAAKSAGTDDDDHNYELTIIGYEPADPR